MIQITLDAALAKYLQQLGQVVELCDPSGNVIGRFVPVPELSGWERMSPDINAEELARRLKSNEKRYTTAEVLAHLEKL
jgi:hypothetical protein